MHTKEAVPIQAAASINRLLASAKPELSLTILDGSEGDNDACSDDAVHQAHLPHWGGTLSV